MKNDLYEKSDQEYDLNSPCDISSEEFEMSCNSNDFNISKEEMENYYKDLEKMENSSLYSKDSSKSSFPISITLDHLEEWIKDNINIKTFELETQTEHSNYDIKKALNWCIDKISRHIDEVKNNEN